MTTVQWQPEWREGLVGSDGALSADRPWLPLCGLFADADIARAAMNAYPPVVQGDWREEFRLVKVTETREVVG